MPFPRTRGADPRLPRSSSSRTSIASSACGSPRPTRTTRLPSSCPTAFPAVKAAAAEYRDLAATRAAHPGRLSLYRLLDDYRERWDALRRREKTLTFRDVARLSLDALESDPDLRRHYRDLFRFVMIDEFQDDDELQKRVLFLIAGLEDKPREGSRAASSDRLFFVGDEKQSIYLFRGADVSVFRRLAEELSSRGATENGAIAPTAGELPLSLNFRSEPGVIDMINAIFPTVMAARDAEGGREDFEARFEPLESRKPTPGVLPRLVYLELPRVSEGDAGTEGSPGKTDELRSSAEAEAWEIARIVRDAVEGGSLLVADRRTGAARKARYEDFAVLLRSTGNQVHFEKYFRFFGVPYGSENACGLFSEAVACDLYYALRLAIYPEDRNALAAFLRSPFAGLSDDALVRVLTREADRSASLGAGPPPETLDLLREGERLAWARGAATMRILSAMADRAPICACLAFLWFETGYRDALLLDPIASAFEEHFELVHSLGVGADSRGASLSAFVAELEPLVGRPDKLEIELPRESSRGVRIMTIHKSKGLEFPVVIVPQANNVGRDRGARDPWYWEDELGPTFPPPPSAASRSRNAFYEIAKERRAAMEGAELKRLLYVALTRAESHIRSRPPSPAARTRGTGASDPCSPPRSASSSGPRPSPSPRRAKGAPRLRPWTCRPSAPLQPSPRASLSAAFPRAAIASTSPSWPARGAAARPCPASPRGISRRSPSSPGQRVGSRPR